MKILVAEDDRATRMRLMTHLKEWGYLPVPASDGAEAWGKFQEDDFKFVLSDWMMPELSGLDLLKKIREEQGDSYVYAILLTSQTDKENLVEGMEAGADDFVTKPFDREELRVRLRAGLRIVELEKSLADRNRELSTFTSVASHDLREPLRTITAFLSLFEKKYKGKLDETADEYIDLIMTGAKRMRTLINDLLSYARVETRQSGFVTVNFREIVDEKLGMLQATIDESGAVINCGDLPHINGDRVQLSQLMQNLIGNAIKYRGDASPEVDIKAVESDLYWTFSIADNGIGIPEEQKDAIFEPFRRLHGVGSKYEGSGIGLAICKKVVERHGGQIWVDSGENSGSIFTFTVPKREEAGPDG